MSRSLSFPLLRHWRAIALPVALALSAALAARLLITNLWRLLAFDATFSAIFAQLTRQTLRTPLLPALVCFPLFSLWAIRRWAHRRPSTVLAGVGLWLAVFLLNVWFMRAGGIRFGDVLRSLLPLLQAGVL